MPQVNGALEVPSAPGNFQQILAQIDRINSSPPFRNCPLLQSFLRAIAEKAMAKRGGEINEYFIATEVFSRMPDFDPSADTIVRTQAYRLRMKLQEYYRTLGQHDDILIKVPKGHYVPVFCRKEQPSRDMLAEEQPERNTFRLKAGTGRRLIRYLLLAVAGLALFLTGRWTAERGRAVAVSAREDSLSAAEQSFWKNFLAGDRQTIVAYTNAQFLGTENGDLLRFAGGPVGDRGTMIRSHPTAEKKPAPNANGAPLFFIDDMTGVGEVLGGVAIADTLGHLGVHPIFKRSRLVTVYDLQRNNVIFLGAPSVNPILNELPQPRGFGFGLTNTWPFLWRLRIDNFNPAPGEPARFTLERDPVSGVLRTDYATISLLPGIAPGRRILVLAGLTTSGTQAAAEALTSPPLIDDLLQRVGAGPGSPKKWPESFQSVWRVDLSRGLDVVGSKLVAVRAFPKSGAQPDMQGVGAR